MQQQDINTFKVKVQNILDWSTIDAGTKNVLKHLMDEVASLVEKCGQ